MIMKNLAVIPARSGSKGLPDKNIKLLNNKPLLGYAVEAAIESGMFDEVMVSTDSDKYAEIAKKCGAKVPFLRSKEMSGDTAGSWDTVKEVLSKYKELGKEFDTVCLLQPTSPLRSSEDIIASYDVFEQKASVAVVSVCEMEHSPLWSNTLPQDGSLADFIRDKSGSRRQDYDTYYRLNGAIYIVDVKALLESTDLFRCGSYAYVMPQERSVDIDTQQDFDLASFYLSKQCENL